MRIEALTREAPIDGETRIEARRRRERNRRARAAWYELARQRCCVCGRERISVAHNIDPEDQLEGPAYYASISGSLHEFRPAK